MDFPYKNRKNIGFILSISSSNPYFCMISKKNMKELLWVGLGGFTGSVCRYLISVAMQPHLPQDSIPWHTLLVNVVGSLLIGGLLALEVKDHWYLLSVVGFCGGFTTFSTFSLELLRMMRSGHYSIAVSYIGLSLLFSLAAVALGFYIGTKINIIK